MKKVTELYTAIDVDIKEDDISVVHRSGQKKGGKPRPVFSEFTSRRSKGTVIQRRRVLKEKEGCVSE